MMQSILTFTMRFLLLVRAISSFTIPAMQKPLQSAFHMSNKNDELSCTTVDIVLFGIGDLRSHDHGGLVSALATSGKVLPLVILDTKDTLPNIPMVKTHTLDTQRLISSGLSSLQNKLSGLDLQLHVKSGENDLNQLMTETLEDIKLSIPDVKNIIIRCCDLGEVDNNLGYGPLSHLNVQDDTLNISVEPWNCHLRNDAWEDIKDDSLRNTFPDTFLDFENRYIVEKEDEEYFVVPPTNCEGYGLNIESMTIIPTTDEVRGLLCAAIGEDGNDERVKQSLERNQNTGLFATHWGGLDVCQTFNEKNALKVIDIFLGTDDFAEDGDEALVKKWKWWSGGADSKLGRNNLSLEHAAINWMMKGDPNSDNIKTANLIEGELLTRYLAAPLLFGLVSPRYIWNMANTSKASKDSSIVDKMLPSLIKGKNPIGVAQTIVTSREWHKMLAFKNILDMNQKQENGQHSFGYWRWHGFLCRYVSSDLDRSFETEPGKKEGIALIHGFGASGSQWRKTMEELKHKNTGLEVLAPDLIGFGQSEKPSLTYTQYLWESYSAAFVKEVGLGQQGWTSYAIGGNSIGGYTAMSAAADDTVVNKNGDSMYVTASGANGSTKCKGLILMNSAGQVFKEDEIDEDYKITTAQSTANDLLGTSSPPPRQIASIGGTGLLWYLRPRIQSICKNLYPTNPLAVDDELCNGILRDSLDPGAINVMISGSKLPPPRTANELLGADFGSSKSIRKDVTCGFNFDEGTFDGHVLVAQGYLDPLNDAKGRAEMFGALRKKVKVVPINAGHCPHDELPSDIAMSIASWLKNDVKMGLVE